MTTIRPDVWAHPSVQRLIRVATALGPINASIVFIGGAIAPLLQFDPPFPDARPTMDVDGVTGSASYADVDRIAGLLRERGFRQIPPTPHLHRWLSPDGDILDLVPAGSHVGGSGQRWDQIALQNPASVTVRGIEIRYADAPTFLALKWAAYRDRGSADPRSSHDLEDIIALVASRATIVHEIGDADPDVRRYVVEETERLLGDPHLSDLLAAHLNNAQDRVT